MNAATTTSSPGHDLFALLDELCSVPAPVGHERPIHDLMAARWSNRADVEITPVGNLVAHVGGAGPKILLLAHGDEIGFTVKSVSDDGYLFLTSGQRQATDRPDFRGPYLLPIGQPARVVSEGGTHEGVFATLTGHILSQRQREAGRLEWNDLWVDVFASDRHEVERRGIQIGDRVVWDPPTRKFGPFISGKAMDNRVGLAVLDLLLDRMDEDRLMYDVYLGSSVQEEIGLIGAHSINRGIGATWAVSIDVGLSGDVPGVDPLDVPVRLGAGPCLIHKDLYAYSRVLNEHLRRVAGEAELPLQQAALALFGSDSGALVREGVAASLLGVPTRYTHSPFETVHEADVHATVDLLDALLTRPSPPL